MTTKEQNKLTMQKFLQFINTCDRKIAEEMGVRGLMNMQYAIEDGKVYVLEANPRASRTVPLVSKVCGVQMVKVATQIMTSELTGNPSPLPTMKEVHPKYYGVKEAVFPFNMFQEVDPVLGPEMRSTGEVLGLSTNVGKAFYKAQEATQTRLPMSGTVLISVSHRDKPELLEVAQGFHDLGFAIMATGSTYDRIVEAGIPATKIAKLFEGRPNILDKMTNGRIDLIINTPVGKKGTTDDSYIRKSAIKYRIPYMTTMAAAKATIQGIKAIKESVGNKVHSLQRYHSKITDKE